ncbi:MAG TPA: HD domain-containing protein [Candidatus Binataceae bacterium]
MFSAAGDRTLSEKELKARAIIRRLSEAGFTAYLAGGCVRDHLLGLSAKDFDIATDATPETVQRIFPNTVAFGATFGVIVVVLDGDNFEVTTFRADAEYLDGRRPQAIRYGTIEDDAARRDFTIGGMYLDPNGDRVIDLVGGMRDLRLGVIRAIGDPRERFREDRLRMLRAVRFAARLGFEIDGPTMAAIRAQASTLGEISAERIGQEIVMILTQGSAARGLDLLRATGLLATSIPEVLPLVGCEQPANFHPEGDVYVHTRLMLSMLSRGCLETLALGVLCHDIAKAPCREVIEGKVTFFGHTDRGAEMAVELLSRLRRPRAVQDRVAYLVRNHLRPCMAPRMRLATLKRMLSEEGFEELLELNRIDSLGSNSYLGYYHFCREALRKLPIEPARLPRLITGDDLISLGFNPGPAFKEILREVEDLQLDGALGSREAALDYVRDHYPPA